MIRRPFLLWDNGLIFSRKSTRTICLGLTVNLWRLYLKVKIVFNTPIIGLGS